MCGEVQYLVEPAAIVAYFSLVSVVSVWAAVDRPWVMVRVTVMILGLALLSAVPLGYRDELRWIGVVGYVDGACLFALVSLTVRWRVGSFDLFRYRQPVMQTDCGVFTLRD